MKQNKIITEIHEIITNKHLNGLDESDRHVKRVFALCMIVGVFGIVLCIVGIYDKSLVLNLINCLKEIII